MFSNPKHIAWLIPPAYLLHILDEYFSGIGFSKWYSELFKVDLSVNDFVSINSVGFAITLLIVMLYSFNKANYFIIAALGSLFFVNGIIHPAATILTGTYSPGTITAIVLYLPLGYLLYKNIFPLMPQQQRSLSVVTGIVIQLVVAVIAFNI